MGHPKEMAHNCQAVDTPAVQNSNTRLWSEHLNFGSQIFIILTNMIGCPWDVLSCDLIVWNYCLTTQEVD